MGESAGMGGGAGMERRKPDFVSRRNEPATVDTTADCPKSENRKIIILLFL